MNTEEAIRMLTRLKDQINFEWTDAQKKTDALNIAIEALQNEPRWIPCSERLPEIGHNILITNRQGYTGEGEYKGHNGYHHVWYQYRWNATLWEDEVLAWMPLPEPFREGESE